MIGISAKIFIAAAVAAGLSLPAAALATEVPAVSGESTPLSVGETRRSLRLRNGDQVPQTGKRLDQNTLEVVREDGCTWARAVDDIYGPNLYWRDCSKGAWGTGKAYDFEKSGQLWPLAVGNKVEYRFVTENSKGKKNRKAFRKCEVTGTETVKAGDREYPTYRVECSEHNGKRVFNYSPEARTTVRMVRNHKKNGTTTVEYLRDL